MLYEVITGLAEPDAYDDKYKKWNFYDLPIMPEQFKIVPNPKTKDQLKTIGELAKRCNAVVNACDAGREGQYIFALIQQRLKLMQPVKRLWIRITSYNVCYTKLLRLQEHACFYSGNFRIHGFMCCSWNGYHLLP